MTRAGFTALPLLGALAAQPGSAGAAPSAPRDFVFARDEFMRRATLPFAHRQLFASRSLGSGVVLHLMANSLKAYNMPGGFGEGPRSLHAAAVLYGTSIATALTDATWANLRLAAFLQQLGDLAPGPLSVNPYTTVVADLLRAHASFFVCNNSLHDLSTALAAATTTGQSDPGQVYAALRQGLIAEVLLVPAGVAAINALAENRFTVLQATV